jgi:Ca-activated chloride channel family protein
VAGDPEPVLGGADFNSAPELAPGVYADTIRPGEQLAYKVPVGWGQAARVTVTAEPDALAAEQLDSNGNTVGLSGYNPVRQKMNLLSDATLGVEQGGFYNGEEPHRMTMALAPVGLRNVESGSIYVKDQNLAGDNYLTVEMARFDDGTKFAAPLRIEVELEGDVSGAPDFDEPESSASAAPEPESGDDEAAAEDDGSGFLLPALGLLVVLAGVVGLGWWAMRRRTPRA